MVISQDFVVLLAVLLITLISVILQRQSDKAKRGSPPTIPPANLTFGTESGDDLNKDKDRRFGGK